MKKDRWINFLTAASSLFALSGLGVMIYFAMDLYFNFSTLDLQTASSVGDFMGGVVGAIWSFTGVLLFFLAIRLQSQELSLQRQEFVANRITGIIYQQISRVEFAIGAFEFTKIGMEKPIFGINGLYNLYDELSAEVERQEDADQDSVYELWIIRDNENELIVFFNSLLNSARAVNKVVERNEIDGNSQRDLQELFFENLGHIIQDVANILNYWIIFYQKNKESLQNYNFDESNFKRLGILASDVAAELNKLKS